MSRVTTAVALFRGENACSQAILAAWAPELGLDAGTAARIAAGFAGGMRLGSVCGAVTGAYMVLGLALCGEECVTRAGRARIAATVSEFCRKFRERCGSLDCPDIIGCDIRTPEGSKQAREQDLFTVKCAPVVRIAAEILEEKLPGDLKP